MAIKRAQVEHLLFGGDQNAPTIEELYRSHGDWLRGMLKRRFRLQTGDADDLVQDTYLRAAKTPADRLVHPKAFLAQIALNLFRDAKRRDAVRTGHRRAVQSQAPQNQAPAPGLLEQEAALELDRLITEMPVLYRDVFALSRFGRMTNRDIAAHLDISVKTVEWRMGKALEFCMSRLQG